MFTIKVIEIGEYKNVTIASDVIGELDLGPLSADELQQLINDFHEAIYILSGDDSYPDY